MENPDAVILLEEWIDSLLDEGVRIQAAPTTPAAQVSDLNILHGTACWGDDGDSSMSSNECNKTLASLYHSDVTSTPSPTRQLFAGTPFPVRPWMTTLLPRLWKPPTGLPS